MVLGPTAAMAQTTTTSPYPGTPTTAPPAPTAAVEDLGPLVPGSVVNVSECNFAAGSTVTITVTPPGSAVSPSPVADSNGCIVVHIEVLKTLVALGSPLHPFAATGLAATANKVQMNVNGDTFTVGPYGTHGSIVSQGTGSNGQARSVTILFDLEKPGTVTRSGIVRTGTTVVKWTLPALGLLGIGYLMVLTTRKRRLGDDAAA
jgi:hypothetical protein